MKCMILKPVSLSGRKIIGYLKSINRKEKYTYLRWVGLPLFATQQISKKLKNPSTIQVFQYPEYAGHFFLLHKQAAFLLVAKS